MLMQLFLNLSDFDIIKSLQWVMKGSAQFLVSLHFALLHFADNWIFTNWSKTLHKEKDYNLLKAQMMVRIF